MAHIFRTVTLIIVLAATSPVGVDSSLGFEVPKPARASQITELRVPSPVPAVPSPEFSLTPERQALVDWATDRFARAGLELPELTVRFDPTRELCDNAEGLYRHSPNTQGVVIICTPDSDTFAAHLRHRRTLLHEFGHAWDFANMSAEDHQELGGILGADAWNDHDDAWADRGVERFAETVVFALLDQPRRQLKVDLACADLLSAFHTATGAEPLGPGLPACAT